MVHGGVRVGFHAGIACGITYGVCRLQTRRDGRTLAICRSLGMTDGRLRLAILSGTAVRTLAGVPLGLAVGALLMPHLLDHLLHHYGIVDFPAHRVAGSLALAAAAGWAAVLSGSWLASAAVKKLSPRSLTEEA